MKGFRNHRRISLERLESRYAMDGTAGSFENLDDTLSGPFLPAPEVSDWPIPTDVNQDGRISPLDALIVINQLGLNGGSDPAVLQWETDVNADGVVTARDVLVVLNELASPQRDTAIALSESFLKERELDWEFESVYTPNGIHYLVIYQTPMREIALVGPRATEVDLSAGTVQLMARE
ncbi:dockerin type I domain-containing protein [Stieleria sp. TO1_6]|uniref:dockerin type I domain-containing protein n=1 Tax=Stieleria tagensis TaxID=2956795 RepID=UPI00209B217B|nr:dockerin type I domain-containing protein [Stieleria tagensis]MCO8125012.1 dockerin type I domain-containing protein [Stieleria tagensis]